MSFSATSSFQAADLSGILESYREAATVAVVQTSEHVLFMANVMVPIDTGTLQRSGNTTLEQMPEGPCGYVNYDEFYSAFVEFGTSRMEAQPYLRPALDSSHDLFLINVKTETANV